MFLYVVVLCARNTYSSVPLSVEVEVSVQDAAEQAGVGLLGPAEQRAHARQQARRQTDTQISSLIKRNKDECTAIWKLVRNDALHIKKNNCSSVIN